MTTLPFALSSVEHNVQVFNRSLVWQSPQTGFAPGILVAGNTPRMHLTGTNEVSSWVPVNLVKGARYFSVDPGKWINLITNRLHSIDELPVKIYRYDGNAHLLSAASAGKHECVLRDLEWFVPQYPRLEMKVRRASAPWRISVVIPGRSRPIVEYTGPAITGTNDWEKSADLLAALRARGYNWQYMRLNVVFSLETEGPGEAIFELSFPAASAVVPQLPLIVSMEQSEAGIPFGCLVLDDSARPVRNAKVVAAVGGQSIDLQPDSRHPGYFLGRIRGVTGGEHKICYSATLPSAPSLSAETPLTVCDKPIAVYDAESRQYLIGGKPLGFLAGDVALHGTIPFIKQADGSEIMINGREVYNAATNGKTNMMMQPISWFSLTPQEVTDRIGYLKDCGYRLFKLANLAPTNLDAGGCVSPFGIQWMAYLLSVSHPSGIYSIVDIYHDFLGWVPGAGSLDVYYAAGYRGGTAELDRKFVKIKSEALSGPYGDKSLPSYLDLSREQWRQPAIQKIQQRYFEQFLQIFQQDARIISYSAGGEGDSSWVLGASWVNAMEKFIRAHDPNHVLTVDQTGSIGRAGGDVNMDQHTLGNRYNNRLHKMMHVTQVLDLPSDLGMIVNVKYVTCDQNVMQAEGDCWVPTDRWAPDAADGTECPNPFTEAYRLMVRDALWISLLNRIPIYWNWIQIMVEDEYRIPTQVSDRIDWLRFRPQVAPVYLRAWSDLHFVSSYKDFFPVICQYESAFEKAGVQVGQAFGDDCFPDSRTSPYSLYGNPPFHEIFPHYDGARLKYGDDDSKWKFETPLSYVFDARHTQPRSAGGYLPDEVMKQHSIITASDGYLATYMLNQERDIFAAYIRNTTHYVKHPAVTRCPNLRDGRKMAPLVINIRNLAQKPIPFIVFDLDTKQIVQSGKYQDTLAIDLGNTSHDFCVLIASDDLKITK